MAYAEKKAAAAVLRAARNGQSAGRRKPPQRPNGKHPERVKIQSTPLKKYRETEGIKDIKSDSYTASKIQEINTSQWEDNGNAQGATSVIRRLKSFGTKVNRPKNPTKITKMTFTFPTTIKAGTPVTVTLSNFGYNNVYDCTTWAYYYNAPSYDYVGYFASSHSNTEEKKTVLAQSGSTAVQNFAFDGMDDID